MIKRVTLKRFKRFADETFDLPGNVVLAGPNNTGKTTLLQAIAVWNLALRKWRENGDLSRHGSAYARAPVTRESFTAVPLREFSLLWAGREITRGSIEIGLEHASGWKLTMALEYDSTVQIYARPHAETTYETLEKAQLDIIHVPPFSGLGTDEPVYQRPKQDQLIGQGKPGDILRNLLVEVARGDRWKDLYAAIEGLFGYRLQAPDDSLANILAEYTMPGSAKRYDIASAGSGFHQVLMLLAFFYARPASILLLDEPDAHLHIILQARIYDTLKRVALEQRSQLIIATHSEIIIGATSPERVITFYGKPHILAETLDRKRLVEALALLDSTDLMLADQAPGILYVEGSTDLDILREWARILNHPLDSKFLRADLFWHPNGGGESEEAKQHFNALLAAKPDMRGVLLVDGDTRINPSEPDELGERGKLHRIKWNRREIESYLIHPKTLTRFLERTIGPGEISAPAITAGLEYVEKQMGTPFINDPLTETELLRSARASKTILPGFLQAAGIHAFEKSDFYEIAAVQKPEELPPEVPEKLDLIAKALGL
ncbi:MAG: AAA family ATPase [Chloroflexi bacterium]|nr:AAA family ATPase [Chloroflexota bacterium]